MYDSNLSAQAFAGKEVFLMECAMATDMNAPPLPPRDPPASSVYFIGSETDPIKIGLARMPYSRLQTLQTGSAVELFAYAAHAGGRSLERDLHREFKKWRLYGEWFERVDPILRRILLWQEQEAAEIERLSPNREMGDA